MQILQPILRIEDAEEKNNMLEVLSDRYCRDILKSIMDKSKSAMEINTETKIPISTVYRRIQILYSNKLLGTSGIITNDGKKLFLYRSKIKGFHNTFNQGNIEVKLIPNN